MSKKGQDWRKLVSEPINTPPAHVDQPVSAMRRTYRIDDVISKVVMAGAHGFRAFKFDEFIKFVDTVKEVHDLNPDVLITAGIRTSGHAGLFATAHGVETEKERKARLNRRAVWLRRNVKESRLASRQRAGRAATSTKKLERLQRVLGKKPKARKKK